MKPIYLFSLLCLLMFACKTRRLVPPQPALPVVFKAPANFRVVGYLLGGDIANNKVANFDLSRINYLNVFFNGQDANHKLRHIPHLDSTVAAAHKLRVTVLACIGNGTNSKLLTDSSRAGFIDSLVSSVEELHLDGIDVDLEGKSIDTNYEAFARDLSVALKLKGKLLTAAIATWEDERISAKSLTYFDFLNIMTYDNTGPWRLNEPGPHSPYSMAVTDLDFWTNKKGIDKNKLNLGLPFYGYCFAPDIKHEFNYNEIVNKFPGAENNDEMTDTAARTIYYNGIPTIKKKTAYAMQNAGGVMIWQLMQDGPGEKSLLTAIDQTANPGNN